MSAVRILPMGNNPEFRLETRRKTREEVQEDYFLRALPSRGGRYMFQKSALNADRGTIVLFQYQNRIIASAVLADGKELYAAPRPDEHGGVYDGEYRFFPDSIRVFNPVDAETVASVWPEFGQFSQARHKLAEEHYPKFESRLTNVRTPPLDLAADDADNDDYSPQSGDERPIISQQIRARRGARKFRDGLLARFNSTCLVTRCRVKDLLEAAHICPHRGAKDDHLQNGLLLRSDIHTLFDLHLLAIEPEQLKVEIHPKLKEDKYYRDLDGKELLNVTDETRPSPEALREHYHTFRRKTTNR